MESLGETVRSLMQRLGSHDGMVREDARESLMAIGEIRDRRSIPALVRALGDGDQDVAWLAAEALAMHRMAARPPILRALAKAGSDSVRLRLGAHHVFAGQKQEGFDDLLGALTKDLGKSAVKESAALDAFALLDRMARLSPRCMAAGPGRRRGGAENAGGRSTQVVP